eukprot:gene7483-7692_t
MPVRTYAEERAFIEQNLVPSASAGASRASASGCNLRVTPDLNRVAMSVSVMLASPCSRDVAELDRSFRHGGFLPAVKQLANVAALPGIVKVGRSIRANTLPDVHSGYGFAIGNVAAFDMANPEAVVSPGGVGFDINCGVRLIRTNLTLADIEPVKEQLAQSLFDHIPVGVGSQGIIPTSAKDLEAALEMGMDWSLRCLQPGSCSKVNE